MNKINWKVRFRNRTWLAGFISQTVLVIQAITGTLAGFDVIPFDLEQMDGWITTALIAVNAVLVYLSYLGIITDPTVDGVGDSERGLNRDTPLK